MPSITSQIFPTQTKFSSLDYLIRVPYQVVGNKSDTNHRRKRHHIHGIHSTSDKLVVLYVWKGETVLNVGSSQTAVGASISGAYATSPNNKWTSAGLPKFCALKKFGSLVPQFLAPLLVDSVSPSVSISSKHISTHRKIGEETSVGGKVKTKPKTLSNAKDVIPIKFCTER